MKTQRPLAAEKVVEDRQPSMTPQKTAKNRSRQVNDVQYITSAEALLLLGVRRETFYTYVSRGLIKSMRKEGSKSKVYRKADIEKLHTRAAARTGVPTVSQSLRYGEPIVQTWISEVTSRGPRYRGHLAVDLVRDKRSFEFASELIWTGLPKTRDLPWTTMSAPDSVDVLLKAAKGQYEEISPLRQLSLIAVALSTMENEPDALDPMSNAKTVLQMFSGASGLMGPKRKFLPPVAGERIAQCVGRGLGIIDNSQAIDALDAALVLSADHELSAPTFAVRICASTGADLYACIAAGLMAQSGPMQVGGTLDVERLVVSAARQPQMAGADLVNVPLPCFSHPLYDRDPRAILLLEMARTVSHQPDGSKNVWGLIDAAQAAGQHPNIFAALVVLSFMLNLPTGSAALLHTLGRTAGWIAHAVEQRLTGTMLRPRARYMGSIGS